MQSWLAHQMRAGRCTQMQSTALGLRPTQAQTWATFRADKPRTHVSSTKPLFSNKQGSDAHLAQWQSIGSNLGHQKLLLHGGGKVNAALQHAAAMAVGGNLHGVGTGGIINKLAVLRA